LPCLPCGDVDNCANENPITISLQKEHNPKEEHKEDNCTPFCHCACCASTIIFQVNIAEKQSVKYFSQKKYSPIIISFSTNNANNIWQPPKEAYI
jgi:hypothetical protein